MRRLAMLPAVVLMMAPVHAQMKGMDHMKGMDMKSEKAAAGAVHKGSGVVKKVDAGKGTVTIAHDPVQSMSWPAMNMTFKAKDKNMLQGIRPDAKVEFSFVQSGKDYVITEIKP